MKSITALRVLLFCTGLFEIVNFFNILLRPDKRYQVFSFLGPLDESRLNFAYIRLWCLFILMLMVVRWAFVFNPRNRTAIGVVALVHWMEVVFFLIEAFHFGQAKLDTTPFESDHIVVWAVIFVIHPVWSTIAYFQLRGQQEQANTTARKKAQ